MDYVSTWIQETLGLGPGAQAKIVNSLIAVVLLWIIHIVVTKVLVTRVEDIYVRYRTRKTTGYLLFLIGILVIGRIWIEAFGSLATYLGILSAGLAVALRDPLVNLAGWLFIIWRRPFEVRDRVQIGSHAGDVIDIRIFAFTLMEIGNWVDADQSTGRVIHVPNGKVFTETVANYSRGFQHIWNEIPVLITFESNWEKAKEILQGIAGRHSEAASKAARDKLRQAARKYMIFYRKLTPTVYTSVKESGVQLTIRYLCEPRRRRTTTEAIWEDVLREYATCGDIEFAYPTRRYFNNLMEGKPGARSELPGETDPLRHSSDDDG